jgi:hypothetical protein
MVNPWLDLPFIPPYVLKDEDLSIKQFNMSSKPIHQIRLELMPEPYLGRPDAPIVLLNLNPGFMEEEIYFHTQDEYFKTECRRTLLHEPQEYPFYLLDPAISESEGHKWWMKKLRQPIELGGVLKVAQSFFCVEYFPYHSAKYKQLKKSLNSQQYSWTLVREAIKRDAYIILMRSRRLWLKAIPELVDYPRFSQLKNPQNVSISPRNCPEMWPVIKDLI